jgi:RNA polymerase sigma-70 factor (ECF subfamily)
MAQLATRDSEEALDLVQESMLTLVKRYADRGEAEWPALFHRILQNRIRDWYRRQKVKAKLFGWITARDDDDPMDVEQFADGSMADPGARLANDQMGQELQQALQQLPLRQQQVFLLRILEGMDVKQTAQAMGISPGSVKTHFSRAVHTLRDRLKDYGYE